jgi:hypothetical protein
MLCQNFSLLMILGINREKTKSPREKNTQYPVNYGFTASFGLFIFFDTKPLTM